MSNEFIDELRALTKVGKGEAYRQAARDMVLYFAALRLDMREVAKKGSNFVVTKLLTSDEYHILMELATKDGFTVFDHDGLSLKGAISGSYRSPRNQLRIVW